MAKKKKVILLVSGGLDSIVAWADLLSKNKLEVYPIFCYHPHSLKGTAELTSVRFFTELLKTRYPDNFIEPYITNFEFDSKLELEKLILSKKISEDFWIDQLQHSVAGESHSLSGFNAFYWIPAYVYSIYLLASRGVAVTSIYTAILGDDGNVIKTQTKQFQNLVQNSLRIIAQNNTFVYESYFPKTLKKSAVIKKGIALKLPLEKTFSSCPYARYVFGLHCGECLSCQVRHDAFTKAKVADTTKYFFHHTSELEYKLKKLYFLSRTKGLIALITRFKQIIQTQFSLLQKHWVAHKQYQLSPEYVIKKIKNKTYLYSRRRSKLIEINDTSKYILEMLHKKQSSAEVISSLAKKYHIKTDRAQTDFETFISIGYAKGIVRVKGKA